MLERFAAALVLVFEGRLSLKVVVLATMTLFWIVVAMFVYMAVFRLYHRLRAAYLAQRTLIYQPAIEMVLLDEPLEKIAQALRPRRRGDLAVIRTLIVEAMRHLEGPPFDMLARLARRTGIVAIEVRALRSRRPRRRGQAMEALGVMKAREGIVGILDALPRERMELRLVALRALASIGDPAVLPYFLETAGSLSPTMLVRLASLMMEFGPTGRVWVARLIDAHRESFSPRTLAMVLQDVALLEPDR